MTYEPKSQVQQRPRHKHPAVQFTLAAAASCGAVTLTNPADVIKIRMQLQGELKKRGSHEVKYRNVFHAFRVVAHEEGMGALQRGLSAAYLQQISRNGVRLGSYDAVKTFLSGGEYNYVANFVAGGFVGAIGALSASPFLLCKVRMQSGDGKYKGSVWKALAEEYRVGGGVRAWYHGAWPSVVRSTVGSSSQLVSYDATAHFLHHTMQQPKDAVTTQLACGFVSSFFVTLAMNPFDVVMTRNYNTRDKHKYSGVLDTMLQTLRTEGVHGFLKGFWAHYARLGPHTILTFFFWERLKMEAERVLR